MKPSHTIRPVFDDLNLVSAAGLVPALRLAESAGLYDLLDAVTVPSPNAAAKTASVVGGMLAGADSIDDLGLLRHGGMARLFAGVRAPSTLGTSLRSFTHGHVQQLDAVGSRLLAELVGRVPGLLAGDRGDHSDRQIVCLDVDDTIREVHGYAKQAAAFGYSGVRALNPAAGHLVDVGLCAGDRSGAAAPRERGLAHRGGPVAGPGDQHRRAAGVVARLLARADSAYYCWAFVGTALRHGAWFSVTARMNPQVRVSGRLAPPACTI